MKKIIKNVQVVTMDDKRKVIPNGYVAIEDSRIREVAEGDYKVDSPNEEIINGNGKILMPGLINGHDHPCATLLRSTDPGDNLENWVVKVAYPMIGALDEPTLRFGSFYQAGEQLLNGITTGFQHLVNINDENTFRAIIEPAARLGFRQVVGKEIRHAPKKAFNPNVPIPDFYPRTLNQELELAERLIRDWDGKYNGLVHMGLTIEAGFAWLLNNATSPESIKATHELAQRYNILVSSHVAGSPEEYTKAKKTVGMGEVDFLEYLGVLSDRWLLPHSLNVSEGEIEKIAKAGARIVHDAISNSYSADGIADFPAFMKYGIKTALGTDGRYLAGRADLFETAAYTLQLHNAIAKNPCLVHPWQVLECATIGGARAIGLENEIGSIEAGKKADIILINPYNLSVAPIIDLPQALIHSIRGSDVIDVYVNGERVIADRRLVRADEQELCRDVKKYSDGLIEKAGLQFLRAL